MLFPRDLPRDVASIVFNKIVDWSDGNETETTGFKSDVAEAIMTLMDDPRRVLKKAEEGSLVHICAIKTTIRMFWFPDKLLPEALGILCQNLENGTKRDIPIGEAGFKVVKRCLRCMVFVGQLIGKTGDREGLKRAFTADWTRILDSCIIISKRVQHISSSNASGNVDRPTLHLIATLFYSVHTCIPDVRASLLSDEVLPLVFALWYYEEMPPGFDPFKQYACNILEWCLSGRGRKLPKHLELTPGVSLSPDDIVKTALAKFKTVYQEFPIHAFATNMSIITLLLYAGDEYGHALQKANAGQLLIGSFHTLIQQPFVESADDGATTLAAAHNYFKCFFLCVKSPTGKPLVVQTVRHGFLLALVHFAPYFAETKCLHGHSGQVKSLLRSFIPPFLVSYDILVSVSDTMRTLSTPEVRRLINEGGFKRDWATFEETVFEFAIIRRLYELDYKEMVSKKTLEICHNCETKKLRSSLLQCSGCRTSLYCNRECQSSNWRQHKTECKELNSYRIFFGFLRCIAMLHVRRYSKTMKAVAQNTLPSNQKFGELAMSLNYIRSEPVLRAVPITKFESMARKDCSVQLLAEEINTRIGVAPIGRYSVEKAIVDYVEQCGTATGRIVFYLELIEPIFRRSGTIPNPKALSAARSARPRVKCENGESSTEDRDEIDEVLEDVYAKLDENSDNDELDVWKALDLVLPLVK